MTPAVKLAVLAVGVGVGFGGGAIVGTAAGPLQPAATSPSGSAAAGSSGSSASDASGSPGAAGSDHELHQTDETGGAARSDMTSLPGGVLISQAGYSLVPDTTTMTGVPGETFGFRIVGPGGETVRAFEPHHERELHLVLVNRDLVTYLHLHPVRAADGRWSIQLPGLTAGFYRAFASFAVADGPELTLGVDLLAPGAILPFSPLPTPAPVTLVDGYVVTLSGTLATGLGSELGFTVQRDGEVTDLQPYLGAWGHLVALRAGDLAYTHVHPVIGGEDPASGPSPTTVPFLFEVPSPGDYRLFFDFAHEDGVHTAAFTVHVPDAGETDESAADGEAAEAGESADTDEAPEPPTPADEPTAPAKLPRPVGPTDPAGPTAATDPAHSAEPTKPVAPVVEAG